jgi:hypothetical protein
MAAYYVKNKKMFSSPLGLSRHFDFFAWQQCFYFYIALELQHIKGHFIQRLCYNKFLNFFGKHH